MTAVIAPDVSEFQVPVTDKFGRRLLILRCSFGAHYQDQHFLANTSAAARLYARGEIDGVILYTVYLGSATPKEQHAYFWRLVGPKVPGWLIAVMLDVETWRGTSYEIRGDHSRQINTLYGLHAHTMGSWASVIGYGNAGDLAALWPKRDTRCKVIVAAYTSRLTYKQVRGAIGQQYTNGQSKWPVPTINGKQLPRSSAPFGNCDHNVFPGFASAKALRRMLRPAAPTPAPPKPPPAPPPPAGPYYPAGKSNSIVAKGRAWAAYLGDDGRIDVRHNGTHDRYL